MKTEEKILNYMDGTLSENESGELLHSLSVSPEKRVVLEQHIKLRELTSFAQKPVAVPQALEASMAERFHAIANYNREIAGGAMIIQQAARPSFISRMATSVAAFLVQYPVRTGFAVAAASVIGYFMLSGSPSSMVDGRSSIVGEQGVTNNQSSTVNNGPSVFTIPSEIAPNGNSISHQSNQSHSSYRDAAPSLKANISSHGNRIGSHQAKPNASEISEVEFPMRGLEAPQKSIIANNKDVADVPANISTIPSEKRDADNSVIDNAVKDNTEKDIAAITLVTDVRSQNVSLAMNNVHGSRQEQNPFKDRNDVSGLPFAFRIYGSLGGSFVNVHQNDATIASRTEGAALIGVDYIYSPNWSFGIEGGNAAISRLITQSAVQSNINGLPSISRVVVSNVVTSGSQLYARAVAHYTFNPYDMIHFEGTIGAGMAFASTSAPLISGALFAGYDLSQKVGVSAGIAFAGAWTKANAQNSAAQAIVSGTDPIGYVTTNHASATLFTPSYGLRAGFKFRL